MSRRALQIAMAGIASSFMSASLAHAQEFPARKPGLWQVTTTFDANKPFQAKYCVDEKTDRQLQQQANGARSSGCKPGRFSKEGSAFIFEQECTVGDQLMQTRTVTTGDFQSRMRSEGTMKYTPPKNDKGISKVVSEAKWSGACPSDWQPGDMELDGGLRVNVNQMLGATEVLKGVAEGLGKLFK